MEKEELELLKEIKQLLSAINSRQQIAKMTEDANKIFDKSDRRVEHATNQIQNTFDRIHDKIFNFNNILIGAFLVLGTFPSDAPQVKLWTIIFPILNMAYMIYIDIRQMEIHRFASYEQDWEDAEREKYGKKIKQQTRLSLISLVFSVLCLAYLAISLV